MQRDDSPSPLKSLGPSFQAQENINYYIRFGRYPYDTYTTQ